MIYPSSVAGRTGYQGCEGLLLRRVDDSRFPNRPRASLRGRVSKTQFARGGTEAACQFVNRKS
jgi:hypothetical protein